VTRWFRCSISLPTLSSVGASFLRTEFHEGAAAFSPDGRWLAYISDESGRYEVYVQPYPGPGGKYQRAGPSQSRIRRARNCFIGVGTR
jgi:hypothetical protein